MIRSSEPDLAFFEKVWRATYRRVREPVEGVLVPDAAARELAAGIFTSLLDRYPRHPGEAEFSAEALEAAHDQSRHHVARDRTEQADPQLHHDPADQRYEKNIDLDRLRRRRDGGFTDPEWNGLDSILRPLGFRLLLRKGLGNEDAEDVFSETFAELARERTSDATAPIETIVVFEEIIPLFTKMIQFRAIDWRRRQSSRKNQPNTQSSFEDLTDRDEGAMQFEDPATDPHREAGRLSFDEIYRQCREALDDFEWNLVFTIHVAQSATMGQVLEDPEILRNLGLERKHSASKKRRTLNETLETALRKLQNCLQP